MESGIKFLVYIELCSKSTDTMKLQTEQTESYILNSYMNQNYHHLTQ